MIVFFLTGIILDLASYNYVNVGEEGLFDDSVILIMMGNMGRGFFVQRSAAAMGHKIGILV